jgi:hypothetical protein
MYICKKKWNEIAMIKKAPFRMDISAMAVPCLPTDRHPVIENYRIYI